MDDDLIARLRAEQILQIDKYSKTTMRRNPDGPEAADRIEALEARITTLTAERDEARAKVAEMQDLLRIEREHRNAPGPF